jgi:hypothetical protein
VLKRALSARLARAALSGSVKCGGKRLHFARSATRQGAMLVADFERAKIDKNNITMHR